MVSLWIKLPVSKSQTIISALNPEKVFWPVAKYCPVFEMLIVETSFVCP